MNRRPSTEESASSTRRHPRRKPARTTESTTGNDIPQPPAACSRQPHHSRRATRNGTPLNQYGPSTAKRPRRAVARPLRREIITTILVNDTVNTGGSTFLHRLREETGA
ncbi:hypothetical protein AB0G74_18750, partial [Streptomyces sp. NPDC020875]|uniref:hypothetical protein n=1 Tax=Streptomyces sp. NPDC020875 TaxID=3154898 RepID=UPI0033D6AC0E